MDSKLLRVDKVARDRLVSIATAGRPIDAIAELIWNGLDADATRVEVRFRRNSLGGITSIEVADDGCGISPELAATQFRRIGGSWKRKMAHSAGGRMLHGKEGQGRLRAFALGDRVRWISCRQHEGRREVFEISGAAPALDRFELSPVRHVKSRKLGTIVRIDNVPEAVRGLESDQSRQSLTRTFAAYVHQYPKVSITYDGRDLDPNEGVDREWRETLVHVDGEGRNHEIRLWVVEWQRPVARRSIFFCDQLGNALHEERAAIQAPHFEYSAYVAGDRVSTLWREGAFEALDLHPETRTMLDAVRERLRGYFRQRSEDRARLRVSEWQSADVYPYEGEAVSEREVDEREAFDACARQIESNWPQFSVSPPNIRRLVFDLLRGAIRSSLTGVESSLVRSLGLSDDRRRELVAALSRLDTLGFAGDDAHRESSQSAVDLAKLDGAIQALQGGGELPRVVSRLTPQLARLVPEIVDTEPDADAVDGLARAGDALAWPESSSEDALALVGVRLPAGWHLASASFAVHARRRSTEHADERDQVLVVIAGRSRALDAAALAAIKDLAHRWLADDHWNAIGIRHVRCRVHAYAASLATEVERDAGQAHRPRGLVYASGTDDLEVWVHDWPGALTAARRRAQGTANQ